MKNTAIIIGIVSALLLSGCGQGPDKAKNNIPTVAVTTAPVEQEDFLQIVKIGGTLRGEHQTAIASKIVSTVTEIPVKIGQIVKEGDLLVRLDPGSMQSQYNQAKAIFDNSAKQLKRMRSLYDAGAISEAQYDETKTQYEVAKASFENARQAIDLVAPFDGMVVDLPVRVGTEVQPGRSVVEIANVGTLRLFLDVPTAQVGQLKVGQRVTVTSPLKEGKEMIGDIVSIADAANKATRSFEVECRFTNPPEGFSPGMYVVAEIQTNLFKQALVVPNDALLYRSGKTLIYSIDADTAALEPVTVLAGNNGKSAVVGNLTVNQRVVVVGQKNLTPGSKIKEVGR